MVETRQGNSDGPIFREQQRFHWWVGAVVLGSTGIVVGVFGYIMVKQLLLGEPVGDNPMSDTELAIVGPAACLVTLGVAWLILRAALITQVYADRLHIRYRGLFVNRAIPFADIARCYARVYRPILEYGGWGVRWSFKHGKAYNVKGNHGVQLELADGKKLLIGSQRADELAQTICERLAN